MRILDLLNDFRVPYQTEGHKHCRPGWVNTECPFCSGNKGLHLGFTLNGSMAACWRCGGKFVPKAIAKLIGVSLDEAKKIIRQYGGVSKAAPKKRKVRAKSMKFPTMTSKMVSAHRKYLESREFDPDLIEKNWLVKGTSARSKLDGISYARRILAPIYWDGNPVSFQTRDITGKHPAKYMACPEDREILHHKDILYGKQHKWKETGICVEGITDVWRLGFNAFSVFGIKFKSRQVRQIAKHFKRVIILFDPDPQAIIQADLLASELRARGVEAIIERLDSDPGDLDQADANALVKKIFTL